MKFIGLNPGSLWSLMARAAALLTGCASSPNPEQRYIFDEDRPLKAASPSGTNLHLMSGSTLRAGDLIVVSFSDNERAPGRLDMNIPDTGEITLPYNVHVQAINKTTTQLEKEIRDQYVPNLFVNLTVSIKTEQRAFFVDGEVRQPGRQQYIGDMTVLRAIGTAGGLTDFANKKRIELRRQGGQKVIVNYNKAIENDALDVPVYPNDHIVVRRSIF